MKPVMRIYAQTQKCTTLGQIYQVLIENGTDVMAEYYNGQIHTLTFSDFDRMTQGLAASLEKQLGEELKGKFVGLRAENSPIYPAIIWGLLMAGYKPLLLDISAPVQNIAPLLAKAGASAMIGESEIELSGVKQILINTLGTIPQSEFAPSWADNYALCTSGTTSTSKVYVFNGETIVAQLGGLKNLYEGGITRDGAEKHLAFLPLHHVFGLIGTHIAFNIVGKTLVYLPDRKPSTILETCRRHRVTHILAVPLVWNNLAKGVLRKAKLQGEDTFAKLQKGIDRSLGLQQKLGGKIGRGMVSKTELKEVQQSLLGPDIKVLVSGGGRILPETLKTLSGVGYNIQCGYGMTELGISSVETGGKLSVNLSGSIGRPFDTYEYKTKPLPNGGADSVGELLIRSKGVHIGQMIDGEFVPTKLDEEGYFHTGDIARLDENNRAWIESRLKEVIIGESGENVYPDEVEEYFSNLPGVEQYCVVGFSPAERNEEIAMVVYMAGAERVSASVSMMVDAFNAINISLPIYKRIRYLYISSDPLPVANAMKVRRQVLRSLMQSGEWNCAEVDLVARSIKKSKEQAEAETTELDNEFNKLLSDVKEIFGMALNLSPEKIDENAHFIYDLGGDSLSSLTVFSEIEDRFGVPISENDYGNCTTAMDAAVLLNAVLKGMSIAPKKQREAARKITKFEESPEFLELVRRKETELAGTESPYFVPHDSPLTDVSIVNGREVLNFASYNYLCLSGHPDTVRAAQEAAAKYGTSASGSRLLTGEKTLHKELEAALAEWKHTEAALVLVGGHSTNVTFVGNFCNRNDLILYDALSHNSILQGCQLSKSDSRPFPHNDFNALEGILKAQRDKYEKVLIIIEGVYSMDGDIAPVPEFVRLKKEYGCFLMVDEAHSGCVIGETGSGVDEYFGLAPDDIDIKMGTLSKGLGTCGGYLAGSANLIEFLKYSVPGFVFSVGLSPMLAAATLEGLNVMRREPQRVKALQRNIADFLSAAHSYGFDTCLAEKTAIIPVLIGGDAEAFNLSLMLLKEGVFVPPAVFPAVPRNQARLRFCVTSDHKKEQIDHAMATLNRLCEENGLTIPKRVY